MKIRHVNELGESVLNRGIISITLTSDSGARNSMFVIKKNADTLSTINHISIGQSE